MTFQQPVGALATGPILSCPATTPLKLAAAMMIDAGCGSILVTDADGRLLGIWTERDALRLPVGRGGEQPIGELMSTPLVTLDAACSVQEAAALLRHHRIRHALVEQDGQPLGMVSVSDIVASQSAEMFLRFARLDLLALTRPLILAPTTLLSHAVARLREAQQEAAAVALHDGSWGILTLRDLVRLLAGNQPDVAVAPLCSAPLRTVACDCTLLFARSELLTHRIRHLGVRAPDGGLAGIVSMGDILASIEGAFLQELQSVLKARDAALLASRHHLMLADKVFDATLEAILITDPTGVITHVNPAFTRITGYSRDEALGQTPALLKSGCQGIDFYHTLWQALKDAGQWQGELVNRRKDGSLYTEHLSISAIREDDGEVLHYVAVFSDITQRKRSEAQLRHLACHDALTGLVNRALFSERLASAIEQRVGHARFAVLNINLDRFKLVNESLGHSHGDSLLVEVARALGRCVPGDATVARLGGDEFGVLYPAASDTALAALAQKLQAELAQQVTVDGQPFQVTSSIGIALYPDDGSTTQQLLQNADAAMRRAKALGRQRFQFYTPDMNASAMARLRLELALGQALERGEFALYYQPKIRLASGHTCGAEALLRWQHPQLGPVSPEHFIPLAEESGLIVPLGLWVLRQACAQAEAWRRAGVLRGRVAVNVSGRQFVAGSVAQSVAQVLAETGLPPQALELEVTESTAMDSLGDVAAELARIRTLGVSIAIDDFGTGYSSLAYLKKLPVSVLKIDRSFVSHLHEDRDDAAITEAIVSMAKSLKLELVAEGVELAAHRAFLQQLGCEYAQGYLFSKPLPVDAMTDWLTFHANEA